MKKMIFTSLMLLVAAVGTQAKSWKIGPSSVTGMDFASINAAVGSSDVSAGDTLYLDQYYNENAEQTVTKRVVIIGTGYDTSLTDEQVVATLTSILNIKDDGVSVKSVRLAHVYLFNEDCVIERCQTDDIKALSSLTGLNHVYSCYVNGIVCGYDNEHYSQFDIQNCVLVCNGGSTLYFLTESIIKNNVISRWEGYWNQRYCLENVKNSEIVNNIILNYDDRYHDCDLHDNVIASGSGNVIEHNILSRTSALTHYPTNMTGYGGSMSQLFTQQGNFSNYYELANKSAAKGYATDGGEVGCHGGMFGCPSGGRPQYIPYFSKVVVGSRTENGKLPVSVTIKIQDE